MTITPRESMLALMTLGVVLFGGSALVARSRLDRWREIKAEQVRLRSEIAADRALIGEREKWADEFASLSAMLPSFGPERKMDVHWLSVMDAAASRNGVSITRRRVGEEKQEGDVYELPIEVEHDGWEAGLDELVRFLFELQSEGAMLDIRQLRITPRSDGRLSGRFSLYCAYRRSGAEPSGE